MTGEEARRAWRGLIARHGGSRRPGPPAFRLRLPPARRRRSPASPTTTSTRSAWSGVGRSSSGGWPGGPPGSRRSRACPLADAYARLTAVPGIGPWTAAEVAVRALGDPDAVSVGDFHLPNLVAYALAGEPRADDARMLELLEPWRGQRAHVVRLLELSGIRAPRYGPRLTPRRIEELLTRRPVGSASPRGPSSGPADRDPAYPPCDDVRALAFAPPGRRTPAGSLALAVAPIATAASVARLHDGSRPRGPISSPRPTSCSASARACR